MTNTYVNLCEESFLDDIKIVDDADDTITIPNFKRVMKNLLEAKQFFIDVAYFESAVDKIRSSFSCFIIIAYLTKYADLEGKITFMCHRYLLNLF
jgi:hypothetical protein